MLAWFEIPEQDGHDWRLCNQVEPGLCRWCHHCHESDKYEYTVMADQEDHRDTLLPVTFLHSYNISVIIE